MSLRTCNAFVSKISRYAVQREIRFLYRTDTTDTYTLDTPSIQNPLNAVVTFIPSRKILLETRRLVAEDGSPYQLTIIQNPRKVPARMIRGGFGFETVAITPPPPLRPPPPAGHRRGFWRVTRQ